MIDKNDFFKKIGKLKKPIPSKTGKATYSDFHLPGHILSFRRVNTNQVWQLDLDQVYFIYRSNQFINTTVIKNILEVGLIRLRLRFLWQLIVLMSMGIESIIKSMLQRQLE